MYSHLPSGIRGRCGETKRKQRPNQPTVCQGNENASLSHDPARRRQIQLRGPIHTCHPCPAGPNQARHSQRAFALFWANSHRQQTSTLTGENLPADPDGRAHFVGFRCLSVEPIRFSHPCTSGVAGHFGDIPMGRATAQTHAQRRTGVRSRERASALTRCGSRLSRRRQRLRAACPAFPDRDTELARFIAEVLDDA